MLLVNLLILLFYSIFVIFLIPSNNINFIRKVALMSSASSFIISSFIANEFLYNYFSFSSVCLFPIKINFLNIYFYLALDGLSIPFLVLTTFLIFLSVLFIWNESNFKYYTILILIVELFLILIFSVLDIFIFYIFYEAILIPVFLMIGIWGSRERKIRAFYLFFFYTLIGSFFMLLAILYIYNKVGTLNVENVYYYKNFSFIEECYLWLAFSLSFAVKIPLYPFHSWLPEAHVEAPTVGSVLLAGILLKLGVYGFFRFNLILFPDASQYFAPLLYTISIIGAVSTAWNAIRQVDIKRMLAYSSISHMNLIMAGIFSSDISSIEGSLFQSISHGFVSGGTFFIVGVLYSRYHSRDMQYYSGLANSMPKFVLILLGLILGNISLPGTSSFIGEFLVLEGIFRVNTFCSIVIALSIILGGAYCLWFFNRISYGNLKSQILVICKDMNYLEFAVLFPSIFCIFTFGLFPEILTTYSTFTALFSFIISFI